MRIRKKKMCPVCLENEIKLSSKNCRDCYHNGRIGNTPKETRMKIAESRKGSLNPMWKGADVGYTAIHNWIRRRLIQPEVCGRCGLVQPYDLANISGEYKRDINDWEWLCRKCHMVKDGRMDILTSKDNRSSQYRGVRFRDKNIYRPWEAHIHHGGKYIHIGSFYNEESAANAYDWMAIKVFGEDARLNFSGKNQ